MISKKTMFQTESYSLILEQRVIYKKMTILDLLVSLAVAGVVYIISFLNIVFAILSAVLFPFISSFLRSRYGEKYHIVIIHKFIGLSGLVRSNNQRQMR